MTLAAAFLAGAKSRLLPASIPFRFFAAAAAFHVAAWAALLAAGEPVTGFRGGPGPVLAVVHLLTLGVLTTTAMGASVQLLPVATRRALVAVWPIKLAFWLTVPGTAALALGMSLAQTAVMVASAVVATLGLLLYAALLADNLRRASSLPVVAAYGWAALAALVLLVVLGLALALDFEIGFLPDHGAAALAHLILGGFGFMGLLVLGFSHVLTPMFALAPAPPRMLSFAGFALASAGVALATAGALAHSVPALTGAGLIGLGAAGVHLWLMRGALKRGMRKRLGLSFLLIRVAWVMLPLTLVVGLAALHRLAGRNGATLFGFLLVGGWLLTFLLGVLQRILPFLASMHAPRSASVAPPPLSQLGSSWLLRVHCACHLGALLLLAAVIVIDAAWLVRIGAGVGLAGALAFAWFTAGVVRRIAAAH